MGLPTIIPKKISNKSIIDATLRDKKAKEGRTRYVLPVSIGKMHEFGGAYATFVDNSIVMNALQQTR